MYSMYSIVQTASSLSLYDQLRGNPPFCGPLYLPQESCFLVTCSDFSCRRHRHIQYPVCLPRRSHAATPQSSGAGWQRYSYSASHCKITRRTVLLPSFERLHVRTDNSVRSLRPKREATSFPIYLQCIPLFFLSRMLILKVRSAISVLQNNNDWNKTHTVHMS